MARFIEIWENESDEFAELNAGVAKLGGVDVLRLLMEQHGLGVVDLPEIGNKSLVSKILNGGGRNLTRDHIAALSKRFSVSPAFSFDNAVSLSSVVLSVEQPDFRAGAAFRIDAEAEIEPKRLCWRSFPLQLLLST